MVYVILFASINNIILDHLGLSNFRYFVGIILVLLFTLIYVKQKPKALELNLIFLIQNKIFWGVALILVAMFIHLSSSHHVSSYGYSIVSSFIVPIMLFFIFASLVIYNQQMLEQMSLGLIIFGALFFVVLYSLVNIDVISLGIRGTIRETESFNAITLARICGLILIPGVLYSVYAKFGVLKIVSIIISLLSLYWLFVTSTRGVILAVFITLSAYFLFYAQESKKEITFAAVGFGFLGLIVVEFVDIGRFGVIDRFFDLKNNYDQMPRFYDYPRAWSIFTDNILLGAGPAGYNSLTGRPYPHNLFLELIAEYGLFGLSAFILIVGGGIYNSFQVLKSKVFDYRIHVFVLLWIYFLIASMFSGNIAVNRDFWVTTGILISVVRIYTFTQKRSGPAKI